jgi:MFS family permease
MTAMGIPTALAGMLALAIGMGVGRFAMTPLLPMMQADAALSVVQGGWLASANYLGYFLGSLLAMVAGARPAAAVRAGTIAIGLLTAAMAFEHRFPVWMALRLAAGIANAWVGIHAISWCLERLAPLRRPLLNGVVFSGVGVGIAAVGAFCLAFMQAGTSSERAWFVLGVGTLLVAAGLWPVFRDAQNASLDADRKALSAGWDHGWWGLVLCFGAAGLGYIIPATFLPVMAWREIQDPAVFGWAWPVFGAAAMASTPAAALLLPRLGNRRLWAASQLVMAVGVALPALRPGLGAVMASALCVGGTFMVITMASMQEARAAGGRAPTALIAAVTAAFALGQIAGPLIAAHFAGPRGDFSGPLLAASVVLALSTLGLIPRRSPRSAGPSAVQPLKRKPS